MGWRACYIQRYSGKCAGSQGENISGGSACRCPTVVKRKLEKNRSEYSFVMDAGFFIKTFGLWRQCVFLCKSFISFSEKELTRFDYGDYLLRKSISGTALAYAGNWRCTGKPRSLSVSQLAKVCQQQVVDVYRSWGFDQDVQAVVSALTIGEKTDLTPELKAMYSAAGVSHVLALSGLHVGILSCILLWLFYPLTYLKHGRKILAFLVVCLLWLFAFISGLSSSVVRAVVMYSLYTFASFCSEERFSGMHSLVLAAFLMLIYNPFFLFDISFQLSFTAVFSILAFYPLFSRWLCIKIVCCVMCGTHSAYLSRLS